MSYSNEKHIEEILYESHAYGFRTELFKLVEQYQLENPKMSKVDMYQTAFKTLVEKYER